jgi:cellulose synthase/poly-beta-1,6-N-acetylglucosamine synthase-like glycosyltransferase
VTAAVALISLVLVVWVYVGYPALLVALGRLRPRPRLRAPVAAPVTLIVPAHNEAAAIAEKVANVRAGEYEGPIEVIVASDGSTDGTAEAAREAGADVVLELPRCGKTRALVAAAESASGELLVFTDADSLLEPTALAELTSAFADPSVGGVSGSEVRSLRSTSPGVARGEGLYWRYEHWIKRLEDHIGSTVSAAGGLYAVRAALFRAPAALDGADDFVVSTEVVRSGYRLAFEERARVEIALPEEGAREFARKIRVMNQGLRAALALGPLLLPTRGGLYGLQVVSHKILRRLVPFFLVALLLSSALLAFRGWPWTVLLALQLGFYALAAGGLVGRRSGWAKRPVLWVPYYFCLANAAAGAAVVSVLAGVRYTEWEPDRGGPAAAAAGAAATAGDGRAT